MVLELCSILFWNKYMQAKKSIERGNRVRGKHNNQNVTNVNVTVHTDSNKRKPKVDPKAVESLNNRVQQFDQLKQLALARNVALPARIGNLDINPNGVKSTESVEKVTEALDEKIKDMQDILEEAMKHNANLAFNMADAAMDIRFKEAFPEQSPTSMPETVNTSPMKPSPLPDQRTPLIYSRTYRDHSLDSAPEFTSEQTGRAMRRPLQSQTFTVTTQEDPANFEARSNIGAFDETNPAQPLSPLTNVPTQGAIQIERAVDTAMKDTEQAVDQLEQDAEQTLVKPDSLLETAEGTEAPAQKALRNAIRFNTGSMDEDTYNQFKDSVSLERIAGGYGLRGYRPGINHYFDKQGNKIASPALGQSTIPDPNLPQSGIP
jgi:hypothetical protein